MIHAMHTAAARNVMRLATQLDRDPDSPTFGSFDRDFWHYKIRDFSSIILQQGMVSLLALKAAPFEGNVLFARPEVDEWVDGALSFWASRQLSTGSFEEYYPYESGFPPAAFSLYAVGLVYAMRGERGMSEAVKRAAAKTVRWLMDNPEKQAMNQQSAALAGIALVENIPGVDIDADAAARARADFYASQTGEGWYGEYGGFDAGYLAVTIDCLVDIHDATGEAAALTAAERAGAFLHLLTGADGRIPPMINARNTDYVVPYGLARLAARDGEASAALQNLFGRADAPDHFLAATDDRYLCHYIGQSLFRSLAHLEDLAPAAPRATVNRYLPGARLWVVHTDDRSAYAAMGKGGVVYVSDGDGCADADFGYRVRQGKKVAVTHWQDDSYAVGVTDEDATVSGAMSAHGFVLSTPVRHIALRIISKFFGRRIVPLLKRLMIFRAKSTGITFTRTVAVTDAAAVTITDRITAPADADVAPAPQYSLRHVASAVRFSMDELCDNAPPPGRTPDGTLHRERVL